MHRLRDSIQCVEAIFRFTAIAAAASKRDVLAEHVTRPPAMGAWRSFCRALQARTTGPTLAAWLGTVADRSADELVGMRNDLVHGAGVTVRQARDMQSVVDDWLALFVTVAATRPALRTVIAGKLEHIDDSFIVDVADLAGGATAARWETMRIAVPLVRSRVYLIVDSEAPADLWPLVLAEPADRPGQWNVSVLDSVTSKGLLRYIDLAHGQRVDSQITTADLAASRAKSD
jgi:hypothetical protein